MDVGHEPGVASFLTLATGTRVVDRFGLSVGRVERVLVAANCSFDGIIVETPAGRRFVDAPEVRSITESVVVLAIARHDVEHPGEPEVLGVPSARWGRDAVAPEDREAVITALKQAYVCGLVDTEGLADAVGLAHSADSLDALDALVPSALRTPVPDAE